MFSGIFLNNTLLLEQLVAKRNNKINGMWILKFNTWGELFLIFKHNYNYFYVEINIFIFNKRSI